MFCSKCGAANPDPGWFCQRCGSSLRQPLSEVADPEDTANSAGNISTVQTNKSVDIPDAEPSDTGTVIKITIPQAIISNAISSRLPSNIAGALCYVLAWISGAVFLFIEKEDKAVRFHAWQSVITFGILTIVICLLFLMPPVPFGILYFLAMTAWGVVIGLSLFLWVLLVVKARRGQVYQLPFIGRIALNLANRDQNLLIARQRLTGPAKNMINQEATSNKFCIICGKEMPQEAKFCPRCGEKQLLEVISQIGRLGRVIEHPQPYEDHQQNTALVRKALDETVKAVTKIAEMRDPYTAGHQRRVTELALAISREMDLPQEQIEGLNVAGLLHDVGKIAVPSDILNKPGRLSEGEFIVIKSHPQVTYDILKTINFPWPVANIAYQHHERLDGSGYPQGLKGKNICLEAKILSVADVVEAIASHRPYRPALGIDKALEEISKNKGKLYDPDVVDVCLQLFNRKGFEFE